MINHTVPHTMLMIGVSSLLTSQRLCAPIINMVCGTVWLITKRKGGGTPKDAAACFKPRIHAAR